MFRVGLGVVVLVVFFVFSGCSSWEVSWGSRRFGKLRDGGYILGGIRVKLIVEG